MPFDDVSASFGFDVPDHDDLIRPTRGQPLPVGRPRHADNFIRVSTKRLDGGAALAVGWNWWLVKPRQAVQVQPLAEAGYLGLRISGDW